jgi:putative ABC transport system permease protein
MKSSRTEGGAPARRVVARWAWRMFRREWRQQALVVAVIAIAVAITAFGVSAAYNVVPSSARDFGSANHRIQFVQSAVDSAPQQIADLDKSVGGVELIGRSSIQVSGATDAIEVRAQDPKGRFAASTLRLRTGHYPTVDGEIAVTQALASALGVGVGQTIAADGRSLNVVGLVENPQRLSDKFILEPPSAVANAEALTVLFNAAQANVSEIPPSVQLGFVDRRPECHAFLLCLSSGQSEQATAGAGALGLATLLLLFVALVAASGFVVVAQRRQRQLGLLAANGATQRLLRLVVVANGAIVGTVAALAGTSLGTIAWFVGARWFEGPAGHRIDRHHVPILLLVAAVILAIVISTAAAWSPARVVARVPIVSALSARPPRPAPTHQSFIVAVVLLIAGPLGIARGIDTARDSMNPLLLIGGVIALVVGIVFVAPAILGGLGRFGTRRSIAPRIALRDLARHRARSSAALAAVTLALAIAVAAIALASQATNSGNLSDHQVLVRVGEDRLLIPVRTPDQLAKLQAGIDTLARQLGATPLPLDVATGPTEVAGRGNDSSRPAVVIGRPVGNNIRDLGVLYVATPPVLARLGLSTSVVSGAEVLTSYVGPFEYANTEDRPAPPRTTTIASPPFTSMPAALAPPDAIAKHGWTISRSGWLLETTSAITAEQRRAARETAAAIGLTVETRDQQGGLGMIRTAATAIGLLLALGILAFTLGLLRSETSRDLPLLTATGATSSIRRALSATTAGALAITGVVLGTLTAYTALVAGYGSFAKLHRVPIVNLAVLVLGTPIITAIGAWLLAGRNPAHVARQQAD